MPQRLYHYLHGRCPPVGGADGHTRLSSAIYGRPRPRRAGVSTQHMREYYRSAGLRDWFVDQVIATQPKDLWVPTQRELEEAGVLARP